ncbi:alpha/beta fold hydrolase [Natronococcus sp.]|uniref:intracellular short-chain-length polyhydroxyalkanoate depolymerase n=1 Tax=Natronococcus sp. TaxID=35747 RepID=UPI003A4D66C6
MAVTLETVDLPNGETIGYRERDGGSVPAVLLHGNMTSSKHWDVVLEAMDDRYKLYAMDMRGFGESSYEERIDSLADFAEDLALFADELGLDRFHLWGWSTGGGVAMEYAATHPDRVRKLVLLAPASTRGYPIYRKDEDGNPTDELLTTREEIAQDPVQVAPVLEAHEREDAATMKAIWNQLIYVDDRPDPERYDEYVADMFTQRNLVDVDYALTRFNVSDEHNGVTEGSGRAADVEADTLVLRGEDDLVITEAMIEETLADLGETATFVELEDCGHSPLIDDRERLLREVESFLED